MNPEEQLALLVKQRDELIKALNELSEKMNDVHASDDWPAEKQAQYMRDGVRHRQLTDNLARVKSEIAEIEPKTRAGQARVSASPLNRFMNRGPGSLSQEEREIFLRDPEEGEMEGYSGGQTPVFFRVCPDDQQAIAVLDYLNRGAVMAGDVAERSDISAGDGSLGASTPEYWLSEIIHRMVFYGDLTPFCSWFMTANGNKLNLTNIDDTAEKGMAVDQDDPAAKPGAAIFAASAFKSTAVKFEAYRRTSMPIWIRRPAQRDAVFDVMYQADMLAERRLQRGFNEWHVTGTGADQPQGIIAAAGIEYVTAASGAFTYDDLVNLIYSVNRAYRNGSEGGPAGFSGVQAGMVGFQMADEMERDLVKLKDGDGRPIWTPGINAGNFGMTESPPNRIMGFPYGVNGEIEAPGANKIPILFGHFGYFGIRFVGVIEILSFFDSYTALQDASVCLGFAERDSRAIGARGAGEAGTTEAIVKAKIKA